MHSVGEQIDWFLKDHEPVQSEIVSIVSELVSQRGLHPVLPRSESEDLCDAKVIWASRHMIS